MNGRAFKLGTFAKPDGKPFAAIVLDDTAIHLAQAHEAYRGSGRPALSTAASSPGLNIQDLLGRLGQELRRAAGDGGLPRQGGRETRRRRPSRA